MNKALIILALLAAPAFARSPGYLNSNGDFVPPPEHSRASDSPFPVNDRLDIDDIVTNRRLREIQERNNCKITKSVIAQPVDKSNPIVCQWEPGPNAMVCSRMYPDR